MNSKDCMCVCVYMHTYIIHMDTCYVTIIIQCKGHEFEDEED